MADTSQDTLLTRCNAWPKADIPSCNAHVRFRGQSGHDLLRRICLLLTQSGHAVFRDALMQLNSRYLAAAARAVSPLRFACLSLGSPDADLSQAEAARADDRRFSRSLAHVGKRLDLCRRTGGRA